MKKFLYLVLALIIASCGEDAVAPEKPVITAYTLTQFNDTLIIFGSALGPAGLNDKVVFNDSIEALVKDASEWSDRRIIMPVPPKGLPGKVFLIIGADTTKTINVAVYVNSLIDAVTVKAGSFKRGSDNDSYDERPQRDITISKDFIISKVEIKQDVYQKIMDKNPSDYRSGEFPVHNLSWFDAIEFCNKLSIKEGLSPAYAINGTAVSWDTSSTGWRLPTEAEWEFACKAGTNGDYSGTGIPEEMGWFISNSGNILHSGALKKSNPYGIFDMHGNLWEWCWDWYTPDYYEYSSLKDPKGPDSGERRVIRGGSYKSGSNYIRSSNRKIETEEIPLNLTGIRIVRNIK